MIWQQHFAFTWCTQSFRYLGIQLTPTFQDLFHLNYHPIVTHIRSLLKTWVTYCILFLGRVTSIKMVILPKILIFFRTLPIYVSKSYIESLQRDINKFIWHSKKNRFNKSMLYKLQSLGDLGLPDLWSLIFGGQTYSNCSVACLYCTSDIPWLAFKMHLVYRTISETSK